MLELKKAEWYETLQDFEMDVIAETIADVKKNPDEYPIIQKFHEIAKNKTRERKARREMEARERQQVEGKILEQKCDSEIAERARAEIRRICGLKSMSDEKAV